MGEFHGIFSSGGLAAQTDGTRLPVSEAKDIRRQLPLELKLELELETGVLSPDAFRGCPRLAEIHLAECPLPRTRKQARRHAPCSSYLAGEVPHPALREP